MQINRNQTNSKEYQGSQGIRYDGFLSKNSKLVKSKEHKLWFGISGIVINNGTWLDHYRELKIHLCDADTCT